MQEERETMIDEMEKSGKYRPISVNTLPHGRAVNEGIPLTIAHTPWSTKVTTKRTTKSGSQRPVTMRHKGPCLLIII